MDSERQYRPEVRVRIVGGSPFLGPGPARLLEAIADRGNVSAACAELGLSYSKGRAMLRRMDAELGYPVVRRSKGGAGGGNAALTPQGEKLLDLYLQYEETVSAYARRQFAVLEEALQGEATR